MIIGKCFENDPIWIQEIQHSQYWSNVATIFEVARRIYTKAEKHMGIMTDIGEGVRGLSEFGHRALQEMHDMIAEKFRYDYITNVDQQVDGQQHIRGLVDDYSNPEYVASKWLEFYVSSINGLFEFYPSLVKHVLTAVLYRNPDKRGIDSELAIKDTLLNVGYMNR